MFSGAALNVTDLIGKLEVFRDVPLAPSTFDGFPAHCSFGYMLNRQFTW
jgi:hypothetical protein